MFGKVLNTLLTSTPQCNTTQNFQREDQNAEKKKKKNEFDEKEQKQQPATM